MCPKFPFPLSLIVMIERKKIVRNEDELPITNKLYFFNYEYNREMYCKTNFGMIELHTGTYFQPHSHI